MSEKQAYIVAQKKAKVIATVTKDGNRKIKTYASYGEIVEMTPERRNQIGAEILATPEEFKAMAEKELGKGLASLQAVADQAGLDVDVTPKKRGRPAKVETAE